ncbi:MAG: hypothetical protein ACRDOU_27520 [Streptosporangiaceae bacterium]
MDVPGRVADHQVAAARHGAGEGWSALRTDQHIHGLGPAFGTKLLYPPGVADGATPPRRERPS